jgi:signal transduction histidine kinase
MSGVTGKAISMAARNDLKHPPGRDADGLREPADGPAGHSNDALYALIEDHDRIVHDVNDTLVHQMFAVSLHLHAALSRIERNVDKGSAAEKIRHAIAGLDQTIRDLRNAVVDLNDLGIRYHRSRLCSRRPPR